MSGSLTPRTLADLPDLLSQVHPEQDDPGLDAAGLAVTSQMVLRWLCPRVGEHWWRARVADRVAGAGCPLCVPEEDPPPRRSLAFARPDLAAQWDPSNGTAPSRVAVDSPARAWWRCPAGHRWLAAVFARTAGLEPACPQCHPQSRPGLRRS